MLPAIRIKDIWRGSLKDVVGHEQMGERPALVLAIHKQAGLCMCIPFTSNLDELKMPYTYLIKSSENNGLTNDSVALVYQLRCLTSTRFLLKLGVIEQTYFDNIKTLTKNYLNL